jgi:hypothetical protein
MAKRFLAFPAGTGSLIFSGRPRRLMAESGMQRQIRLKCSIRLVPAIDTIAASLFLLVDNWLSTISYLQGHSMDIYWPHILSSAAEIGILLFKGIFKETPWRNTKVTSID